MFIPKQISFWKKFDIRFIAIFVGETIPEILEKYTDNIILYSKNLNLNSAYVAQNIRMYYTALLSLPENEMVMITDMDMLPTKDTFYKNGLEHYTIDDFIYYRHIDGNQIYMCYNAAHPSTWSKIFEIKSIDDIESAIDKNYHTIYTGLPGSAGWFLDQEIMYNKLIHYPNLRVLNRSIKRLEVDAYRTHLQNNDKNFVTKYDDVHFHRNYFTNEVLINNAEKQLITQYDCDLIIGVYACDTIQNYKEQILKVNETWGKVCSTHTNIKLIYFLGEEKTEYFSGENYVNLKGVKNDYLSASYKQFLGLKHIYENYRPKMVLFCGTDTYLNIEKLLLYIKKFNPVENLYIGGHGCNRTINNKNIYFHSGGPGFILTYTCLSKLYPLFESLMSEWTNLCQRNNLNHLIPACDVAIGYYIQLPSVNSTIIKTDDLSFLGCNYLGHPCHLNMIEMKYIISCHYMSLNDFDTFTTILNENNYFL